MTQFLIHHGMQLANRKVLQPNSRYATDDEVEIAELRDREERGEKGGKPCEEVRAGKPAEPEAPKADPADDITEVPGVGAKTLEKLAAHNITTRSALKAAVLADDADVKQILGPNFEKVQKHFQA